MTVRKRKQDNDDEGPAATRARREEFARERAAHERALEKQRRWLFTEFGMWTICPDKRCARAQACAGDVARCMNERWHVVIKPETKAYLQKFFDFMREGYTLQEAARMAKEQMDLHLAALARLETESSQEAHAPSPAPAPPPRTRAPDYGPRIRFP